MNINKKFIINGIGKVVLYTALVTSVGVSLMEAAHPHTTKLCPLVHLFGLQHQANAINRDSVEMKAVYQRPSIDENEEKVIVYIVDYPTEKEIYTGWSNWSEWSTTKQILDNLTEEEAVQDNIGNILYRYRSMKVGTMLIFEDKEVKTFTKQFNGMCNKRY